jgi:GNAT superfamily N-acetyltransferase
MDLRCRRRREGTRALLGDLWRRLRRAVSTEEQSIVLAKDLGRIVETKSVTEVRVDVLEARHLPALAELNRKRCFRRADRRFERDVERGYNGYVGFCGDELIGYYWWVDEHSEPLHADLADRGLGIELSAGDVYGCDYFVLEQFRGGGIAGNFLYKIEADLASRGYKTIWGYVVKDNRPARWLYSLRGYEPMRTVLRRTMLFRQSTETVTE